MLQGSIIDDGVSARLLSFDTSLELDQNMVFDEYAPNTYFFGFLIEPDGYVIFGEQGPLVYGEGTFIMKLDFDGNVIWNEIMQPEIEEHIYRNYSILSSGANYIVAGSQRISGEHFGLVTILNTNGITQSEIEVEDNDELRTNHFKACKLLNDEILLIQSVGYELVDENGNPNLMWSKTRLMKFDTETETFYGEQDYFDNYEMILGGPNDLEPTPDGGAVILGGRYGTLLNNMYAWILKVDADGNEEWFHEYTYEDCEYCENLLYDIEVAPDGGYVAAGYFKNTDVDLRNNPWLLKVDACGDLEWQGCAPVGVEEKEPQSFSVYPNPSNGRFTVAAETTKQIKGYAVVDMAGRVFQQTVKLSGSAHAEAYRNETGVGQFEISVNVPSGLYLLRLAIDDGSVETYRVEVVR